MRKILVYLVFLLLGFEVDLNAQVTIGSGFKANEGSLLDLKEHLPNDMNATSSKGLLLPRVKLTDLYSLKDILTGIEISAKDNEDHIGLVVYSVTKPHKNYCSGIYIWDGSQWTTLLIGSRSCLTKTPIDKDGNIYDYDKFGSLFWTTSNIRTSINNHFMYVNVQGKIYTIHSETNLDQMVTYTENGSSVSISLRDFGAKFGFLYSLNQAALVCPEGWRLPTSQEWNDLADLFGGKSLCGKSLKAKNVILGGNQWNVDAAADGSDDSGFNVLPSGYVRPSTMSSNFGQRAYFWHSSGLSYFHFTSSTTSLEQASLGVSNDYHSVRCVRSESE